VLDITDTAGMEEFSAMRDQWYRTSTTFAIVTCNELDEVKKFIGELERVKDRDLWEIPCVIAISKIDSKLPTDLEAAKAYAEEIGVPDFYFFLLFCCFVLLDLHLPCSPRCTLISLF
jgi:GTPase KRas protein